MISVIGGLGSIGRRYCAILKSLGVEYSVYDTASESHSVWNSCEKAIIATPTETHYQWASFCQSAGITFLVEKPMSKRVSECEAMQGWNGYVVNNYAYCVQRPTLYDHYNTGKDGVEWDCCQLIYLNPRITIKTESPEWILMGPGKRVNYSDLERSYIEMVSDFVNGNYGNLWTMKDGLEMTKAVLGRIDERFIRDTGQEEFEAAIR